MGEKHREPEVPEVKVRVVECRDGLARITLEELAITHFMKSGTLQNACSTRPGAVANSVKSAHTHIVRLMNNLVKGPKRMMTKSEVAMVKSHELFDRTVRPVVFDSSNTRQLGCVFQDMKPPKSILRKSTDMQRPIQRLKFTKAIARHTKIRDQNPSLGYICPGEPHQCSPNAPKFEDRSQEETEWQEQGAREAAWKLAKCVLKIKRSMKEQHSSHLRKIGACLHQILNLRNENLLWTPVRQCI